MMSPIRTRSHLKASSRGNGHRTVIDQLLTQVSHVPNSGSLPHLVIACQFVGPFHKCALGVFHDVALVHDGNAAAPVVYCVLNCAAHDVVSTAAAYRLDADAGIRR